MNGFILINDKCSNLRWYLFQVSKTWPCNVCNVPSLKPQVAHCAEERPARSIAYGGFLSRGGTPRHGGFNGSYENGWSGGTPILGNYHMETMNMRGRHSNWRADTKFQKCYDPAMSQHCPKNQQKDLPRGQFRLKSGAKFHPKFTSEVRHFNSTLLVSWKKILLWCLNPMPQKNEMSPKFEPQFHLNGTDTFHEDFEKAVRNDDQLFVQRLKNMWEYIGIPLTLESQIFYIKYSNMCGHWYANHL